jgi:uncharacterized membrane protein YgaE (UPF0421/DUF939 family)
MSTWRSLLCVANGVIIAALGWTIFTWRFWVMAVWMMIFIWVWETTANRRGNPMEPEQ